ncbi:acyltransferase [Streptomyces sp. NPDC058471]|uniref:acyltransferase n=1 Tax=Streptomyces sp. NPDC058471 TaxID=3346516 RepID=UPI0036594044
MTLSTEDLLRLTVTTLMSHTGQRQGDLAAGLDLAQTQVSRKQSGKLHWSLADVDKIAAHYGIGVLDLLAGPTQAVTALAGGSGAAVQSSLSLPEAPAVPVRTPAPLPRSEALSGPCVLCGEAATDQVEGIWQHLTREQCAAAVEAAGTLADYPEDADQEEEFEPTGPGEPAVPHPEVPQPAPELEPAAPAPVPAEAEPARSVPARAPGYASETLIGQISARVRDVLAWSEGDMDKAKATLIKSAIPDVMALFERSRVGGRYAHSQFPPTDDVLHKKSQKTPDQIWEARPKWKNPEVSKAVKAGDQFDVSTLDMNAAYLAAFKCWLPIGKLVEDTTGVHVPKKSGVYQITPPEWTHKDLPNPLGDRKETGPAWVPDSLVRLLLDCAKWDLCEAPVIHRALLSGGTESLLEKLRRALSESRSTAISEDDDITVEYVKAMYSKFVSTLGESGVNTEIRRPDWMHMIRTKAHTNLWRKAYKARESGLTVVRISGTDELHVRGDWRKVFPEGRELNQVKEKEVYSSLEGKF